MFPGGDFFLSLMMLGAAGGSDSGLLPFWQTANRWGLMPEYDGGLALLQARKDFDDSRTLQLGWGSSLACNAFENPIVPEASRSHLMVDELYGSLGWKPFSLDIGMKHRDLDFLGSDPSLGSLSTTGGHVIESGNARTMPGYLISLKPVPVPWTARHVWLYGAYGDFKPLDKRYSEDPLIHRTRIGFRFDAGRRVSFHFLLDHYAIWGGTITGKSVSEVNLKNYLRMVTGRHAGSDGTRSDQLNVIGDQGGGELWQVEYRGDGWKAVAQHDIPYADGSGMGFQNFPDGVNTLSFSWNDKDRWISDIVYEYTYTMYQSGPFNGEVFDENGRSITPKGVKTTGGDNYFNNGEYRSGWTSYGRSIGTPLMYPRGMHAGSWTSAAVVLGLENNRLKAHHLGMGGKFFRKYPYRLMLTRSWNYGTYATPYAGESAWNKEWGSVKETPLKQFSVALDGLVRLVPSLRFFGGRSSAGGGLSLLYGLYCDHGSVLPDSMGVSVGARLEL